MLCEKLLSDMAKSVSSMLMAISSTSAFDLFNVPLRFRTVGGCASFCCSLYGLEALGAVSEPSLWCFSVALWEGLMLSLAESKKPPIENLLSERLKSTSD